jgi:hypothetical protein
VAGGRVKNNPDTSPKSFRYGGRQAGKQLDCLLASPNPHQQAPGFVQPFKASPVAGFVGLLRCNAPVLWVWLQLQLQLQLP